MIPVLAMSVPLKFTKYAEALMPPVSCDSPIAKVMEVVPKTIKAVRRVLQVLGQDHLLFLGVSGYGDKVPELSPHR